MSSDDHITVRDWRRRPPLRLRVTKKLDIRWCWIKCTLPAHARGRDRALHHPLGTGRLAGHAAAVWSLQQMRPEGCHAPAPVMGRSDNRLGADANQPDGAR
jgi:hypothetical protein